MISKIDLQEKLRSFAFQAKETGNFNEILSQYLTYVNDNYKDLDDEAKVLGDKAFEIIHEFTKETIKQMPDGIQKRQLQRMYAKASGKHWDITSITDALEKPTHIEKPILKATREFFIEHAQLLADLMHDVLENSLKGSDMAILGLYYSGIDELIVAFHLAQHNYGPQVLAHIRAVYEIRDKIELFSSQPEHLDLWASDDQKDSKKILYEYSAKGVRKKLGKESYDPIYSFLSEMGSHPTLRYLQSKVLMRKPENSSSMEREARIWVGGSPREDHLVMANTAIVQGLITFIVSFIDVYGKYLLAKERIEVIRNAFEKYRAYMLEYFCNWMKENGTDASDMEKFIKSVEFPDRDGSESL